MFTGFTNLLDGGLVIVVATLLAFPCFALNKTLVFGHMVGQETMRNIDK